MALSILIFLLALGMVQGLLLVVFFLSQHQRQRLSHVFLIGLLLTVTCQLLAKILSKNWLTEHIKFIYLLTYEFPFLIGPLLLGFIQTHLNPNFKFRWLDTLHFLPFVLIGLVRLRLWYIPDDPFTTLLKPLGLVKYFTLVGLQLISVLIYGYWALRIIRKQSNRNPFLYQFVIFTIIAELLVLVCFKTLYYLYPIFNEARWLFLILSIYIYWISYQILQRRLGYWRHDTPLKTAKYSNSTLKSEAVEPLKQQLLELMEVQQLYKDANLNIDQLAQQLGITRHHLSQLINEGFGKNYADFVNGYRITDAKLLLIDPDKKHYTIASIAFEVGFNSLSTFNQIFKKMCQVTPSEFRKKMSKS